MRTIILIVTAFLSGFVQREPDQEMDFRKAVRKADFVAFVLYEEGSMRDEPIFVATEVFKGNDQAFNLKKVKLDIDRTKEHILIAKSDGGWITDPLYPLTPTGDLSDGMLTTLNNLPCQSQMVADEHVQVICHKDLDPYCGCDKREYHNFCALKKAGIIRFRPGSCDSK